MSRRPTPPATDTGLNSADPASMDARGRRALADLGVEVAAPPSSITVTSPLTGTLIGAAPASTPADVAAAARRARLAQESWAAVAPHERARVLLRIHDLVWKRADSLLDLLQWESGKARAHAFEEVADVAMTARHLAYTAPRHLRLRRIAGLLPLLTRTTVHHRPKGVVAVIAPWNYPLTLVASDALAALMAGNAALVKPDSLTPFTAIALRGLFVDAGLDPDLFQVLPGAGSEIGAAMVDQCDHLMFTGSTATGAKVASLAAAQLKATSAELGGKNPLIVCEDAAMGRAVRGAVKACFSNAGQLCISIERIYVVDSAWERFVPAFVEAVGRLRVGATLDWSTSLGPLITAEHAARVDAHVRDAEKKGASVLVGGHFLPEVAPSAYAPTVLTGVTPDMEVFAAETFGPVVSLYRVSDEDEAVVAANDSAYGLNASVWTRDTRRGEALARRIHCGTVNVNEGYVAAWGSLSAPMGGMKTSGLGRRHGAEGVLRFTESQTIATQRLLNVQAPTGIDEHTWARVMTAWLRTARHLPFLDR